MHAAWREAPETKCCDWMISWQFSPCVRVCVKTAALTVLLVAAPFVLMNPQGSKQSRDLQERSKLTFHADSSAWG
jgi:hypothetical protein